MFVSKQKGMEGSRPSYRVLESYRVGGEVHKHFIVNLGRYPTVELAYQAALKDSLRASDKLERFEYVMSSMMEKRA